MGLELRDRGHEVEFFAPSNFDALLRDDHGFVNHPGVPDIHAMVQEYAQDLRSPRRVFGVLARELPAQADQQLERLDQLVPAFDLVVCTGLQLAARAVCELHRVPYQFITYVPQLLASRHHPPFFITNHRLPGWVNLNLHRLADALTRWGMYRRVNAFMRRKGLPKAWSPMRHILGERPIVCCSPQIAPLPEDGSAVQTGQLALPVSPDAPLPDDVERFLRAGPPPVYIGFGSMVDPTPEATATLIRQAAELAQVRVAFCVGWTHSEAKSDARVLFFQSAPHATLLPRCAAVIHHGGAGTTHAATRAGVPQMLVPHLLDQFYFAPRIERLGVGPAALPRPSLTPELLAKALKALCSEPSWRERAQVIGAQVSAETGRQDAAALLEGGAPTPAQARSVPPLWRRCAPFVALALLWGLLKWPPHHPEPWNPPPEVAIAVTGDLDQSVRVGQSRLQRPEDIIASPGGGVLASCEGGAIYALSPTGDTRLFAQTGGRPLGMAWGAEAGTLLVADADRGLLAIRDGQAPEVLLDHFEGQRLRFVDDVTVDDEGVAYVSDATQRMSFGDDLRLEAASHEGTGTLLRYAPNGAVTALARGLYFANGVALHPDGQSVLVGETMAYRIQRCPRDGRHRCEVWVRRLPGLPDNIRVSPRGTIWVALFAPRRAILDRWIHPSRAGYWAIAMAPSWALPKPERRGQALELRADGEAIRRLVSSTGEVAKTTSAREIAGELWLGHLDAERGGLIRTQLTSR